MNQNLLNLISSLTSALGDFWRGRRGNVATTFALAAIPAIGLVGAAVDLSRENSLQAALQNAVDSTALYVSREAATDTTDQLQTAADNNFRAVFTRPEAKDATITVSYTSTGGSQVVITGTTKMDTQFMGIIGVKEVTIKATSVAKWGMNRLRVALALDNTGSMSDDGKIDALKTATKNLLTQLQAAASTDGDVYVSIIPFSKDVNVGKSYYAENWLTWSDWNTNNGSCSKDSWSQHYSTKSSCQSAGGTWTADNHNTWNGCVMDRGGSTAPDSNDYDQKVTAPGTTSASKFPAEQYSACVQQMMGLNYDWTSMKNLVDKMTPNGSTNQPIGLVWGWQSLVGGGPLTAPAEDANYTYSKIIILLSDGLNTQDRWFGNGVSVSTSVDKRMYDASDGTGTCANIKAAGITIYAIQVNTGGDPTSTLLQNCATSSDKFFMLTSADQIVATFQTIGTNLTKLRIVR